MLHNYWYIAALSEEVTKKPYRAVLFGKPLVVYRAKESVVCLEDRCAHRNTPLSAGKICGDNIQCPYHGWEYDTDGRVAFIPSLNGCAEVASVVNKMHCCEQDGYIWVSLGEPAMGAPPVLPKINERGFRTFRMKTHFLASVDQCLENFLDCPHAAFVHRAWFRSPTSQKVKAVLRTLKDGAEVEYINEPREKSVVHKTLLFGKNGMKHTDRFIAPATSRVDYYFNESRHYIITSHTPLRRRHL